MRAARSDGVPLSRLAEGLFDVAPECDISVSGLALDSRRLRPGDLFLACSGTRGHGLSHLREARESGACAVLWEPPAPAGVDVSEKDLVAVPELGRRAGLIADRFHDHPSEDLRIVGITGTDGKTSCAHFLAQALSREGSPCGVIGTVGQGLYGALEESIHTTPDAVTLQQLLADMRDQDVGDVVMEVSSHALDQERIAGTRIGFAVLTNLSRDHLDYHRNPAAYAAAKARLFRRPGLEAAIVNYDDAFGRELLSKLSAPAVVVYGFDPAADDDRYRYVIGTDLALSEEGFFLRVRSSWGRFELRSRLLGRFNASNLLAVLATLLSMGEPPAESVQRLTGLQPVPGRMERHGGRGQPLVVVDYAHTPNSLQHALGALREHTRGRLLCVFGCGGDRDTGKRAQMARVSEQVADRVIVTDDNPRTENPDRIVDQIVSGFRTPARVTVQRDRGAAIALAVSEAGADDTVLVAGKGHECYQLIGQTRHHFSDREAVLGALGVAA